VNEEIETVEINWIPGNNKRFKTVNFGLCPMRQNL